MDRQIITYCPHQNHIKSKIQVAEWFLEPKIVRSAE